MKKTFVVILIIGTLLRFYSQFIIPTFNVDEISLGNNIKYSTFKELLFPLNYGQTAPPLYLLLQKFIVNVLPFHFWISIKILSFISSIAGLYLFYCFIKKQKHDIVFVLLLSVFAFNPFVINNSLTLKQYTIDLTLIVLLLNYYTVSSFKKHIALFFLFWCLFSNVGLFSCAGYLLYLFLFETKSFSFKSIFSFISRNILILIAPLPYVFYFFWFMQQDGALELKKFMDLYWQDFFIPINENIGKYLMVTFHAMWIYMLNAFEIWGAFLFLIICSFLFFVQKKTIVFRSEIMLLLCILVVHLLLNVLKIYPFSDRLYLYILPLLLLILGSNIIEILKYFCLEKLKVLSISILTTVTIFLYVLYFPNNDNCVLELNRIINKNHISTIYCTQKAADCINNMNKFIDFEFESKVKILQLDTNLNNSNYLISRVGKKIKRGITSPPEPEIADLLAKNRLRIWKQLNGYNIYQIMY